MTRPEMKRRGLFALLGGVAVAAPVAALAKDIDADILRELAEGEAAYMPVVTYTLSAETEAYIRNALPLFERR